MSNDIEALLRVQQAQLRRFTHQQGARMLSLLKRTRQDLRDRLDRSGRHGSLGAGDARALLAQIEMAVVELEQQMKGSLGRASLDSYELAKRHVREQLDFFGSRASRKIPALQLEAVAALQDEVLLQKQASSVRFYGSDLIRRAQDSIAMSTLQNLSWEQAARRLAGVDGVFAQDYTGGQAEVTRKQSRGERIVRTELMYAYNRAHMLAANELENGDPGWLKQLIATFDTRTGADSKSVHGQLRATNELFEDNEGRKYMHPPNRPNDREVVSLVRPEWIEAGLTVPPANDAKSVAALAKAKKLERSHAG